MAEHARPSNIKVPNAITIKMNPADLAVAAEVMAATGLTDGVQLIRYALRAAQRELVGNRKSSSGGRGGNFTPAINPG